MSFHFKHTDMKKLKFWMAGVLFASLVGAIAVNINLNYSAATDNSDFSLTNVEALAQGETGEGDCAGSGSLVCGDKSYKVRISN